MLLCPSSLPIPHSFPPHFPPTSLFETELPSNVVLLDTAVLERALYSSGMRPTMMDPKTEKPRAHGTTLSLEHLLISFTLPPLSLPNDRSSRSSGSNTPPPAPIVLPKCTLHNAGNDAFMTLFAFQQLMEPHSNDTPTITVKHASNAAQMASPYLGTGGPRPRVMSHTGSVGWPMVPMPMAPTPIPLSPPLSMNGSMMPNFPSFGLQVNGHRGAMPGGAGLSLPNDRSMTTPARGSRHLAGLHGSTMQRPRSAVYDLAGEFGNLEVSSNGRSGSSGPDSSSAGNGRGRNPMPRNHSSPGMLGKNGK